MHIALLILLLMVLTLQVCLIFALGNMCENLLKELRGKL